MSGFTKLYIGEADEDFGDEWTYSKTAWEAMTKLELIQFNEVHIEELFCCAIGSHCDVDTNDIVRWLEYQKHQPKIFIVYSQPILDA